MTDFHRARNIVHYRELTGAIFLIGLVMLLAAALQNLPWNDSASGIGQTILLKAPDETGAANIVTSILLAYRGLDTLGELTILFVAATAAGLVLGHPRATQQDKPAGFILRVAADLLFPLLLMLGAYIIAHGHLSPGGGFQGGAIVAAAFFIPFLANPNTSFNHDISTLVEGFAGTLFIAIGFLGLIGHDAFLAPLLGVGTVGALFSAGSLPLLYVAVGLKVGAELAGLIIRLAEAENS